MNDCAALRPPGSDADTRTVATPSLTDGSVIKARVTVVGATLDLLGTARLAGTRRSGTDLDRIAAAGAGGGADRDSRRASGGLGVVVWWAFFSGAVPLERRGAPLLMLAVSLATVPLLDISISSSMMGLMFPVYTAPVLSLVCVAWAVATRRLADGPRRVSLVAAIVLASGFWTLLRTDGMTGDSRHDLTWRWTETAEARLLATATDERLSPLPGATKVADDADWPGFRGRNRDGIVRGTRIATDWEASPPEELWRRSVGPGVGSFSVRGQQIFTQEQRGDQEMVSSYLLATGEPVWRHADPVRFWDSHAGAGPRATPTVAGDRLYALGARGC